MVRLHDQWDVYLGGWGKGKKIKAPQVLAGTVRQRVGGVREEPRKSQRSQQVERQQEEGGDRARLRWLALWIC